VKEFLSRAGRSFVERNVDEDEQAYKELVARGWLSVPVTVIGDRSVVGFRPAELRAALAAVPAGGPNEA
jgi:glutaredoxin